jgi:hypothetical protein
MVFAFLALTPAFGQDIAKARKQNQAHVKQCTERHGYDPEKASSLGPHALGAGEREWRECVYQGIEKYLIPNTLSPEAYRKAIAEDRKITAAIAGGKMTRAQRQARVEKIIEDLEALEKRNAAKVKEEIESATGSKKSELQRQQELMGKQDLRSIMHLLVR